ncbi:MAG: pilus assembly protein PilX [Gammaproteobacteria bacterium]|nr:pilus assembly protein PilX [Gammaproteobacteria bacterium]
MNRKFVRQKGSTLVISLMILIVMTLIGITGIASSTLEEKMAGNTRDQALAFQAAEAALRDGEQYWSNIVSLAAAFNGATEGLYALNNHPDILDEDTWDNSRAYAGEIEGVKGQPRFIIELLGQIQTNTNDLNMGGYGETSGLATPFVARVTARAVGGTDNTVVILQSNVL